jgi:WD40 domain-containing protein
MGARGWPFLVSCNQHLEYRTIVAPDFICQAKVAQLLADTADGDLTDAQSVVYRDIYHSAAGDIALVFRVIRAVSNDIGREGQEGLKDLFGRPIYLIEGVVLQGQTANLVLTNSHLIELHKLLMRHYQDFWDCTSPPGVISSGPLELKDHDISETPLRIKVISPFDLLKSAGTAFKVVQIIKNSEAITSIAFSPTSKLFAARACNQAITLWDSQDPYMPVHIFRGPIVVDETMGSIAFSPNGRILAGGMYNAFDYVVKLWDLKTSQVGALFGHSRLGGKRCAVAFAPDGRRLASSKYKTIKLWAVSSESIATTGEIATLEQTDTVNDLNFSPDGRILASGGQEGTIELWNVKTYKPIQRLARHLGGVNSVVFSPDGQVLGSAGQDGRIKLWHVTTGKPIWEVEGHASGVNTLVFTPDGGALVSGGYDRHLKIWDASTGKGLSTLAAHTQEVTSAAFSPDGRTLASASKDGTIRIWR